MLTLKNHHDLMCGDGAFAENLPAAGAERKIDDGGGKGASGGTASGSRAPSLALRF